MSVNLSEQKQLTQVANQQSPILADVLVMYEEMPLDFYKNSKQYQAQLDVALLTAQGLIHEISDDGRKKAKSDVALIRKYTSNTNKFSLSVFRSLTDKVKLWRDGITDKTKALDLEADAIMARFETLEANKLATIRSFLTDTLNNEWNEQGIDQEFRVADVEPLVKLTGTLTETGNLTGKSKDAILAMVHENLVRQHKIEARLLTLENSCLRNEINPPLSRSHLGTYLYADDQVFNAQLDKLIDAELERREEMQTRLEAKMKADNQRISIHATPRLDGDTSPADSGGQLNTSIPLPLNKPEPVRKNDNRTASWSIHDSSPAPMRQKPDLQSIKTVLAASAPTKPAALPDKRTVQVTAVFNFNGISNRVSSKAVVDHFIKLLDECPKIKLALESAVSVDVMSGEQHESGTRNMG